MALIPVADDWPTSVIDFISRTPGQFAQKTVHLHPSLLSIRTQSIEPLSAIALCLYKESVA